MATYPRYRYEKLFPSELRRLVRERPIAYMGLGPLEWHGEHLAFGTDPARASALVEALWRHEGGALLPPLHLGIDIEQQRDGETLRGMETFAGMRLPGSILIDEAPFSALLEGMASSLERNGFALLVLCTGHLAGKQVAALQALAEARRSYPLAVLAWPPAGLSWPKALCPPGSGHAGVDEACEMAFLRPSAVRPRLMGSAEGDRRVDLLPERGSAIRSSLGRARFRWELGQLREAFLEALDQRKRSVPPRSSKLSSDNSPPTVLRT
ncbi:MAG TPA: creatininase family protein [Rectinemataceae bacterium]|nr:creatininase family protein [Rectinemataceae bacterium]